MIYPPISLGVTFPAAVLKFTFTPLVTPAILLLKSVIAVHWLLFCIYLAEAVGISTNPSDPHIWRRLRPKDWTRRARARKPLSPVAAMGRRERRLDARGTEASVHSVRLRKRGVRDFI